MEISRRNALKIIGATPVAAGLGIAGADAAGRRQRTSMGRAANGAGGAEGVVQAEILHGARVGDRDHAR